MTEKKTLRAELLIELANAAMSFNNGCSHVKTTTVVEVQEIGIKALNKAYELLENPEVLPNA